MQKLLKSASYKKMPWKNRKGITSEIYIHPEYGGIEKLDFDFRLSSAPIIENSTFSKFPGYNRILLPIKGPGFILNGHIYETFEVAHFSGEGETQCELIDGEVLDLGLIFNPKYFQAQIKILNFERSLNITTDSESFFIIFVLSGSIRIGDQESHPSDCWLLSQMENLFLQTNKKAKIAFFTLKRVTE